MAVLADPGLHLKPAQVVQHAAGLFEADAHRFDGGDRYAGKGVKQAIDAWRATDGRFDPTVLHALEAAGYDDTFEVVRERSQSRTVVSSAPPGHAAIDVLVDDLLRGRATPAPGCAGIVLDHERGTVALPAGVGLDLGGIGKGAAADA